MTSSGQTSPQTEASHCAPVAEPLRSVFAIREAHPGDADFLQTWLPQALVGTPAAQTMVAVERVSGAIVGAATLRVFADRVARFTVFVLPEYRRRGYGRALLNSVRAGAEQQQVAQLLSESSLQVGADDEPSLTATAFCRASGLSIEQDVVSYRAELSAAVRVLEPLYKRCSRPATRASCRLAKSTRHNSRGLRSITSVDCRKRSRPNWSGSTTSRIRARRRWRRLRTIKLLVRF